MLPWLKSEKGKQDVMQSSAEAYSCLVIRPLGCFLYSGFCCCCFFSFSTKNAMTHCLKRSSDTPWGWEINKKFEYNQGRRATEVARSLARVAATTCVAYSEPTTNTQTNNTDLGSCAGHSGKPRKICYCLCKVKKHYGSCSFYSNKLQQKAFPVQSLNAVLTTFWLFEREKNSEKMLPKYFTLTSIHFSNFHSNK